MQDGDQMDVGRPLGRHHRTGVGLEASEAGDFPGQGRVNLAIVMIERGGV